MLEGPGGARSLPPGGRGVPVRRPPHPRPRPRPRPLCQSLAMAAYVQSKVVALGWPLQVGDMGTPRALCQKQGMQTCGSPALLSWKRST